MKEQHIKRAETILRISNTCGLIPANVLKLPVLSDDECRDLAYRFPFPYGSIRNTFPCKDDIND